MVVRYKVYINILYIIKNKVKKTFDRTYFMLRIRFLV